MRQNPLITLFVLLALPLGAWAGDNLPPVKEPAAYRVPGLELTPDQEVSPGEGYVVVQAQAKGPVKWLVLGKSRVKFSALPDRSVVVSVPPTPGETVAVFAVADDGKGQLTEFARSLITVKGQAKSADTPAAGLGVKGTVYLTFVGDSPPTFPLTDLGPDTKARFVPRGDPSIGPRGLQKAIEDSRLPYPVLLAQDASGKFLPGGRAVPAPTDLDGVKALVKSLR